MKHKTGCLICGAELQYLEESELCNCYYCGETFSINEKCLNGHYVCDGCHSLGPNDLIEQFCCNTESENLTEIILSLMKSPQIKMHGAEHHFLVPAALLTVYYNMENNCDEKVKKIKLARKRAEKVPGGFCGNCGAAVGTGIFVSLINDSTPLSENEWKLCTLMTAQSLLEVAKNGGPRCCKRDVFLSINETVKFLKEHMDVNLQWDRKIKCNFFPLNKECKREVCVYYKVN